MQRWQNPEQARCTAIKSGKGKARPKAAKEVGPGAFPGKTFLKLEGKYCILGTFVIVSHEIMLSRYVRRGRAPPN